MQGLLSFINTPAGMGLLSAAAGYASGAKRGTPVNNIGRGLLGGLVGYGQAQERELELAQQAKAGEWRDMQITQAKESMAREQQLRDAAKASYTPAMPAMGLLNGSLPAELQAPQVAGKAGGFDNQGFLGRAMQIDPIKGMEWAAKFKTEPKYTVVDGNLIRTDTEKPQVAFTAPAKPEAAPSSVREYEFARGQGYQGSYEQWTTAQKKAGASNTSVSVNTEKSLLNDIAGGVGKSIVDSRGAAHGALGTISTVGRLYEALDSGKVLAGPGTTFRQYGLQVGNILGVAGKDAQEKLLNTRQAIQSLAQLELDAAQQMKGQGAITESERSIIRRAASGDIDGMTTGELRLLGGVLERTARSKIRSHNSQVQPLVKNPSAAPIAPFLTVEEPAARTAPASSNVLRFDANGNPI